MEIISRKEALKKGLSTYFTGKPCNRNHISERNTINRNCRECVNENAIKRRKKLSQRQEIIIPKEKKCPTCNLIKSSNEFYKYKGSYDGLGSQCISCSNSQRNSHRKTPKGRVTQHEYAWKKNPIEHKYRPNFKFNCLWCGNAFLINGTPKGYENALFCSIQETYIAPKKTCSKKCNDALYNNEIGRERKRKTYQENPEERLKRLDANRKYRKENEQFRETLKNYRKTYREENKDSIAEYKKEWIADKRKNDLEFKILDNLSHRIREAIKAGESYKSERTLELLGCSIAKVKKHLESQFSSTMNWENYGEWQIDHIRPCASFNLLDTKQQKVCFNWRNLQPMEGSENNKKRDIYNKTDEIAWVKRMIDLGYEGELFLKFK